ncbi:hypothetical protein [Acidiphilium multivorum]|nr:hypothetical protein [Acidiphilium multivorum]
MTIGTILRATIPALALAFTMTRLEQRPENSPMKTAMYCGRVVS